MSELDEDVEGMQSTILLLQQQLRFILNFFLDVFNIFIFSLMFLIFLSK